MKRGEIKRGFNQMRKHIRDYPSMTQYIANCQSCIHYHEDEGCRNGNVTMYDVVVDGNREFCSYWSGIPYDNGRKNESNVKLRSDMEKWLNTF